jgi:hypothetical protein
MRHPQPIKPPLWLNSLKRRVAKLDTAEDWLRLLVPLRGALWAYELIKVDTSEGVAVVTPSGNVGQVCGPYDHFLVNLSAPDGVLTEEFRSWLKLKRLEVPPPIAKRGPAALNGQFGEDQFRKWRDRRIVEYGALLIWRERLPKATRKLVTKTLIGEWTECYESNDRKRTWDALESALAGLPALAAQVGATKSH